MTTLQIVPGVLLAVVFHALALCITTRLMIEVRVRYPLAVAIVAIEYLVMALLVGGLVLIDVDNIAITISAAGLAYLFAGAACIAAWIRFTNGMPVGVGNGVLIQAIQIPIIIPVLIAGSFLYDLFVA